MQTPKNNKATDKGCNHFNLANDICWNCGYIKDLEATTPSLSEGEEWSETLDVVIKRYEDCRDDTATFVKKLKNISKSINTLIYQTRQEERERMVAIGEGLKKENEDAVKAGDEGAVYYVTGVDDYQQKIKSRNN